MDRIILAQVRSLSNLGEQVLIAEPPGSVRGAVFLGDSFAAGRVRCGGARRLETPLSHRRGRPEAGSLGSNSDGLLRFGLSGSRFHRRLVPQTLWMKGPAPDMTTLKQNIKTLMVETLMLQITAAEISDEQALFGPGSLGLDSVDALQLVVALDKEYGLKISDPNAARVILQNISSIAEAVTRHEQRPEEEKSPVSPG